MNDDLSSMGGKAPRMTIRFSVHDLSMATGRSLTAIRTDRARGKLDTRDLVSLSRYVLAYAEKNFAQKCP